MRTHTDETYLVTCAVVYDTALLFSRCAQATLDRTSTKTVLTYLHRKMVWRSNRSVKAPFITLPNRRNLPKYGKNNQTRTPRQLFSSMAVTWSKEDAGFQRLAYISCSFIVSSCTLYKVQSLCSLRQQAVLHPRILHRVVASQLVARQFWDIYQLYLASHRFFLTKKHLLIIVFFLALELLSGSR